MGSQRYKDMMNHSRIINLFEQIKKEVKDAHIAHVQVLHTFKNGNICIKFTSVDNDYYKNKVREICDRYCESLYFVSESKTTMIYSF